MDELDLTLDGQCGQDTRVRCFAHVLNLVVKVCPSVLFYYVILDADGSSF